MTPFRALFLEEVDLLLHHSQVDLFIVRPVTRKETELINAQETPLLVSQTFRLFSTSTDR
jgi:hypothetical protein